MDSCVPHVRARMLEITPSKCPHRLLAVQIYLLQIGPIGQGLGLLYGLLQAGGHSEGSTPAQRIDLAPSPSLSSPARATAWPSWRRRWTSWSARVARGRAAARRRTYGRRRWRCWPSSARWRASSRGGGRRDAESRHGPPGRMRRKIDTAIGHGNVRSANILCILRSLAL